MHEMIIVEPSPNDMTLQQAATIAGCNAKTLRRAVQSGQLPRHYLMSRHGPQLVFQQSDVEGWLAQRHPDRAVAQGQAGPAAPDVAAWPDLPELLAGLQARLCESQAMIAQLYTRIEDQDRLIDRAQSTIAALTRSLLRQETANATGTYAEGGEEGRDDAGSEHPADARRTRATSPAHER